MSKSKKKTAQKTQKPSLGEVGFGISHIALILTVLDKERWMIIHDKRRSGRKETDYDVVLDDTIQILVATLPENVLELFLENYPFLEHLFEDHVQDHLTPEEQRDLALYAEETGQI